MKNLRYQPVVYSDGTLAIHETIIDNDGNIKSATYEAVRLEALSFGELISMLRQVYNDACKIKPLTEDELEAVIYGSEATEIPNLESDDEDNVVDLVDYFSDPKYYR